MKNFIIALAFGLGNMVLILGTLSLVLWKNAFAALIDGPLLALVVTSVIVLHVVVNLYVKE